MGTQGEHKCEHYGNNNKGAYEFSIYQPNGKHSSPTSVWRWFVWITFNLILITNVHQVFQLFKIIEN